MNFAFNEEQEELRAAARGFLTHHSASEHVRRAMASDLGYDSEVWKRIATELGWPSLTIPEEQGGLGLGAVELTALLETMGEVMLCAPFFSTVCLGANALLVAGSEAQRQEHLPGIAEGRTRATLACGGARGRWEAAGVETVARRDGSDYRLAGSERFVLDGHSADLLVVAARREGSEGPEGVSLFLVGADAPGVERRRWVTMDPTRRLAQVELLDVRVSQDARMGAEGEGWKPLREIMDRAAVALAAEQVGGAQRCLDLAVEYAKQRVQFGRPIGSFQAIKHRCADMMVRVETARSASYYAACVAAQDGEELGVNAALAKATASEAYLRCAADCLQIHGGVGFTWEYDVQLHFKRARSMAAFLGDAVSHRERVAQLIGL